MRARAHGEPIGTQGAAGARRRRAGLQNRDPHLLSPSKSRRAAPRAPPRARPPPPTARNGTRTGLPVRVQGQAQGRARQGRSRDSGRGDWRPGPAPSQRPWAALRAPARAVHSRAPRSHRQPARRWPANMTGGPGRRSSASSATGAPPQRPAHQSASSSAGVPRRPDRCRSAAAPRTADGALTRVHLVRLAQLGMGKCGDDANVLSPTRVEDVTGTRRPARSRPRPPPTAPAQISPSSRWRAVAGTRCIRTRSLAPTAAEPAAALSPAVHPNSRRASLLRRRRQPRQDRPSLRCARVGRPRPARPCRALARLCRPAPLCRRYITYFVRLHDLDPKVQAARPLRAAHATPTCAQGLSGNSGHVVRLLAGRDFAVAVSEFGHVYTWCVYPLTARPARSIALAHAQGHRRGRSAGTPGQQRTWAPRCLRVLACADRWQSPQDRKVRGGAMCRRVAVCAGAECVFTARFPRAEAHEDVGAARDRRAAVLCASRLPSRVSHR